MVFQIPRIHPEQLMREHVTLREMSFVGLMPPSRFVQIKPRMNLEKPMSSANYLHAPCLPHPYPHPQTFSESRIRSQRTWMQTPALPTGWPWACLFVPWMFLSIEWADDNFSGYLTKMQSVKVLCKQKHCAHQWFLVFCLSPLPGILAFQKIRNIEKLAVFLREEKHF